MPILIGGVLLLVLLLPRKASAAEQKKQAADKAIIDAANAANAAAERQRQDIGAGVGTGIGALGGVAALIGKLGAATGGAVAGATGGAAAGGAAGSGAGGTAAAVGGASVGATVGGAALSVVGALGFFTAIGMGLGNALGNLTQGAIAAGNGAGLAILKNGYKYSMRRVYDENVRRIEAALPASVWAYSQGAVRNTALLVTLTMFRKINELYRAGILEHPQAEGSTWQQHVDYWAQFGVFIPDWDGFAREFAGELGAGSYASIVDGATQASDAATLDKTLRQAETLGKFIFYAGAVLNQSVVPVADGMTQAPWVNRWAISEPVTYAVQASYPGYVPLTEQNLSQAVAGARAGLKPCLELINGTFQANGHLDFSSLLFIEGGLMMDFNATVASGQLVYTVLAHA